MNNDRRNSIAFRTNGFALSLLLAWMGCASAASDATQLDSVTIGFSSFSGFYGPLWLAVEDGVGKKYGVDLRAVYAGRVRPQQLLASGETPFVIASGSGAVTSHVLGVKDQVIVALLSSKLGGGIFSKSEIKRPEDLKGKVIATGRPGALNDILVRYVMMRKWGLSPDRDVKLMPIGEPPLMLQALERGVVDASSLSVPASFVAKSKGFFELVNYDALGISYPQHAVTTLRPTIAKNPEMVERVLKTLIESVAIFKSNKQKSFAVWRKYMRGASEEFLEDTYQHTVAAMEAVPTPSVQVIASALDMISVHYPQAKQTDPDLIVDPSFVRRIEQSGFISALYKK
ncbi:MAG TPA: ABC transporter substrate-binding protein [Candidatus Limnocylindrales bacterium]|nr:ABC transporter substrate-binding protein [Candidatus Limnocylindrales bacterium]